MGEDSKPTRVVAYIDGKPVDVNMDNLPEITPAPEAEEIAVPTLSIPDFSITMDKANEAMAQLSEAFRLFCVQLDEVARNTATLCRRVLNIINAAEEFKKALRWADEYNRPLAYRYHHTKKKRIRKKYAKRILAWYREEVLECCD